MRETYKRIGKWHHACCSLSVVYELFLMLVEKMASKFLLHLNCKSISSILIRAISVYDTHNELFYWIITFQTIYHKFGTKSRNIQILMSRNIFHKWSSARANMYCLMSWNRKFTNCILHKLKRNVLVSQQMDGVTLKYRSSCQRLAVEGLKSSSCLVNEWGAPKHHLSCRAGLHWLNSQRDSITQFVPYKGKQISKQQRSVWNMSPSLAYMSPSLA